MAGTRKGAARSAASGRFISKAAAARHSRTVTRDRLIGRTTVTRSQRSTPDEVAESVTVPAKGTKSYVYLRSGKPPSARRSSAADDPLAPERTRYLVDAVGGGRRLAAMLGVSPSQPSRWASGQERPGSRVAPLLIDLEHVVARVRLIWPEPAATTWITSANAHLGGARPIDVLALSGPGSVLSALDADAWGGSA